MIKVEGIQVFGWESAIRGMRNPMNSWDRSDSWFLDGSYYYHNICDKRTCIDSVKDLIIGDADLSLMQKLFHGGTEHRKFMRMIIVYMDITAPLYWWKEYDTYKVGTVANSCSTMHKIHAKGFAVEDFSTEHLETLARFDEDGEMHKPYMVLKVVINCLNACRNSYLQTKSKTDWWNMIQLLPTSYNQKRTVMINYEVAATIIRQRTGHKLDEWRTFVDTLKDLPYLMDIMS